MYHRKTKKPLFQMDQDIVQWTLNTFALWSGLRIKFHKGQVFLFGKMDIRSEMIERIFGCSREDFSITYSGIPIKPGRLRKEDRLELLEKLTRNLKARKKL